MDNGSGIPEQDGAGATRPSPPQSASSGAAAFAAERRYADIVTSCRLSVPEVTGFVAEARVDPELQEINYQEHIKAWVAIIFEIRSRTTTQSTYIKTSALTTFWHLVAKSNNSYALYGCEMSGGHYCGIIQSTRHRIWQSLNDEYSRECKTGIHAMVKIDIASL